MSSARRNSRGDIAMQIVVTPPDPMLVDTVVSPRSPMHSRSMPFLSAINSFLERSIMLMRQIDKANIGGTETSNLGTFLAALIDEGINLLQGDYPDDNKKMQLKQASYHYAQKRAEELATQWQLDGRISTNLGKILSSCNLTIFKQPSAPSGVDSLTQRFAGLRPF